VDRLDGETYPYCTGTLISPTILLTAAHCYPETTRHFGVTFEAKYTASSTLYRGTFYEDPILDIAVVKFNQDIPAIDPDIPDDPAKLPNLPTAGQFNTAAKGSQFTAVGYGGDLAPKEPGGPLLVYDDQREWAVTTLNSVTQTYLRLSQKQGGGTCYGDSGGPNFLGEYPYNYDSSHVPTIASITITGDSWCKTTNVTLRLDIKPVRDFLRAQGVLQVTQCSDGQDNDNDDKIDFGRRGDPDCVSETDDSESS
jgi:hypothetical protein